MELVKEYTDGIIEHQIKRLDYASCLLQDKQTQEQWNVYVKYSMIGSSNMYELKMVLAQEDEEKFLASIRKNRLFDIIGRDRTGYMTIFENCKVLQNHSHGCIPSISSYRSIGVRVIVNGK